MIITRGMGTQLLISRGYGSFFIGNLINGAIKVTVATRTFIIDPIMEKPIIKTTIKVLSSTFVSKILGVKTENKSVEIKPETNKLDINIDRP